MKGTTESALDYIRRLIKHLRIAEAALKRISEWSVPVDDPNPDDPQTEYGQIKKFAREALHNGFEWE